MDNFDSYHQIGEGTFGRVYRARSLKLSKLCAVKRIQIDPHAGFPFTTIREIRILKKLTHPNIVPLLDVFIKSGEMFISMEYLPYDLSGLTKSTRLDSRTILSLSYQLIDAVTYIHSLNLLHRDIKSSNILVNRCGTLKLADFGLTRNIGPMMTNRVCTLWYRPPELLLGCNEYTYKVDSWSIGCVILEMALGEIPFKGNNEIDQVHIVFSKLGAPKEKYRWSHMFEMGKYENNREFGYGDKISKEINELCSEFLRLSPRERISPGNALKLSYLTEYKDVKVKIDIDDVHDLKVRKEERENGDK